MDRTVRRSPITGPAKVLVPRAAGKTHHYPSISPDGKWVVFNESGCDGPMTKNGWGDDPCDGYNDVSARLVTIAADGGPTLNSGRANADGPWTSSWPRYSPDMGAYRQRKIYWVAFSSRRPYGLRLEGAHDDSVKPQIWFAAVLAEPVEGSADPSFAPVWLPNQNEDMQNPSGNHAPQWVERAIPIE